MTKRALIAFTASLFLIACGGDDDGDAPYMCVGAYATITNEQFNASASATGSCVNDSDLQLACNVDLSSIVGICGASCFQANMMSTPAELGACTAMCVKANPATVTDPSDACLGCYVGSVGCTLQNCKTECGGGPTAPACVTCRADHGCTSTFYSCSGLPTPPNTGDGG